MQYLRILSTSFGEEDFQRFANFLISNRPIRPVIHLVLERGRTDQKEGDHPISDDKCGRKRTTLTNSGFTADYRVFMPFM